MRNGLKPQQVLGKTTFSHLALALFFHIFVKCSTRQRRESMRHVVSLSRGSRLLRDSPTRSISPSDWGERLPPRGAFLTNLPTHHHLQSSYSLKSPLSAIILISTKQAAKLFSSAAYKLLGMFSTYRSIHSQRIKMCP